MHGLADGAGEVLAMRGPGDVGAVAVAWVDGHLEWEGSPLMRRGCPALWLYPPAWDPPHRQSARSHGSWNDELRAGRESKLSRPAGGET